MNLKVIFMIPKGTLEKCIFKWLWCHLHNYKVLSLKMYTEKFLQKWVQSGTWEICLESKTVLLKSEHMEPIYQKYMNNLRDL